jgi:fructosamine-3-kinase
VTPDDLTARVETQLDTGVTSIRSLSGGMIGDVYRVELADGRSIVAKAAGTVAARLSVEGYMLDYLARHSDLPVPQVLHSDDTLLLMTFVAGSSHLGTAEQQHAADLLAALHSISDSHFGLERDTLIGPLQQPNPQRDSWLDFFRDHRLLYMAQVAHNDGPLPARSLARIETLAARLDRWLLEPNAPSLIHGDMWTTNVLAQAGRITAFLDPAIYYAHAEIELAYSTLFGTFGDAFFQRYQQHRPIAEGFFEERRHIYNLYPLLVHVRLFGGNYADSVSVTLSRFGC